MATEKRVSQRGFKKRHIFGVICVIGLVVFGVFRFYVNNKLGQRIEVLRGEGYPMSSVELDDWYRESASTQLDNAWPVYVSAFELLVKWNSEANENLPGYSRQTLYEPGESWTPVHVKEALVFLADNKDCLELLYEGADIGYSFRPLDFTQGFNMTLSLLSETRECAKLLRLASQVAVQQGDIERAIKAIDAIFVLADSVNAPVTIMNLVKIAIWGMGVRQIEDVLCFQALTEKQGQTLSALLEPIESTQSFKQSLIGERCSSMYIFNASAQEMAMFSNGDGGGNLWMLLAIPRRILGLHDLDTLSCINLMQAYIEASSLPRHEALRQIKGVEKEYQGKLGMVTRMLKPALNRIYELELRSVAGAGCARTALAVERYRLGAGHLPETLNQLVPTFMASVPLDPFDGSPVRFKPLDKGFVVYSVGPDLTDDQGEARVTGKNRKNQTTWDETFVVSR
jgi:hypothetical protein